MSKHIHIYVGKKTKDSRESDIAQVFQLISRATQIIDRYPEAGNVVSGLIDAAKALEKMKR